MGIEILVQPNSTTVVIASHNRAARLLKTLERLSRLSEVAAIIVADNGSNDGSAAAVRACFPDVAVLDLPHNYGAYGRTLAVRMVATSYVAFCDDDSWWMPGSIGRGIDVFRSHPRVGALNARIIVEPRGALDPACAAMERAVPDDGPGLPILFFTAGAVMMRTTAFVESGGYERRLGIGAEEMLLALDLQRHGWQVRYMRQMEVRHEPCAIGRDDNRRRLLIDRNRLWTAWMRYRARSAWRLTARVARRARNEKHARCVLLHALSGLPWTLMHRAPISTRLQRSVDELASRRPEFA